jgi:hypothetical protein|tara:strand:- start:1197 stop:1907 length:711 start_codon:yes stop_codon:yes gene_type:complete
MAIDLNSLHVAAGGSSGSTATINDADIRGIGGSVRAAGSGKPLDFDWFEESPFVIATFPSIGNWGETSTSTLSNPKCWVEFHHDTSTPNGDRIRVGYKTSNVGTTYTELSYTQGTGNLLDNLTWQAKASWSMDSETTSAAYEPSSTTQGATGTANNTWINISKSAYTPHFEWGINNAVGEVKGSVTFSIRVLKTSEALPNGLYLPGENGFTSESETFNILKTSGGGGGGGGGGEQP